MFSYISGAMDVLSVDLVARDQNSKFPLTLQWTFHLKSKTVQRKFPFLLPFKHWYIHILNVPSMHLYIMINGFWWLRLSVVTIKLL
jgi:hypothetical protein